MNKKFKFTLLFSIVVFILIFLFIKNYSNNIDYIEVTDKISCDEKYFNNNFKSTMIITD